MEHKEKNKSVPMKHELKKHRTILYALLKIVNERTKDKERHIVNRILILYLGIIS